MEATSAKFEHFFIARRANGTEVELRRSTNEVVFLAFDAKIRRLVELHVLKDGTAMDQAARKSAFERCKLATEVRGLSFMRVLEAGEQESILYFSSNLTDGEFAEDYVARRGPVPPVTVFCLMQQFLEDLLATPKFGQLVSHMRLNNPLVTTLEDTFLQLRVVDYGMMDTEEQGGESMRRCVAECCRLLFLLLTGQPFDGQNPDQVPAMTCLPMSLRTHLRTALLNPEQASSSLDKLRDDVREAYSALVSNLQVRTSRKHIVVTEALQPQSQLKELLLEKVPVQELLKGRFAVANGDDVRGHPFSISAVNIKTDQPVTVHLLPPSSIVQRDQYEAVPLQMWRFNPERHPNILRSLSVWENPDWTLLTEEREPGFALSRLMAERITLNPPEVLALLRQVRSGMEQAMECGVRSVDLHPSNLVLRVGKGGPTQAREFERLMQKRIDAWPPFTVKLRTHLTMRSLYEPLLVEPAENSAELDPHMAERDLRHRSFLGLAVYLLTGERQAGGLPAFGEAVPDTLAAYFRGCLEAERAPSPADFVEAFEHRMGQNGPEGRGIAAIMAASGAPAGDIEDAGAISDFDEDWSDSAVSIAPPPHAKALAGRKPLSVTPFPQARRNAGTGMAGMYVWAAAALALLLVGRFMLFGGAHAVAVATPAAPAPAVAVRSSSTPVVAARFSSAPSIPSQSSAAGSSAGMKLFTSPPAVTSTKSSETPAVIAKPGMTQPASSHAAPAPSPASVATVTPAAPAPTIPKSEPPAIVATSKVADSPPAASVPRTAPALPKPDAPPATTEATDGPITIKKAIVPSRQEVSETLKDHPGAAVLLDKLPYSQELVDGHSVQLR